MTHACNSSKLANMLGAFALAGAERVRAATEQATGRPAADTAALVALATWLDGASQEELGRVVGLSQTGSVRLVDRLARDGLVERRPGADGRTHSITVSRSGAAAGRAALERRGAALGATVATLDPGEREQLNALLGKLLGGLTATRPEARHTCRLCDVDVCEPGCPVTAAADREEAG